MQWCISNQKHFKASDLENAKQQLPHPFFLVGDFNSHNEFWGSEKTDLKGKQINQIIEGDRSILLNYGEHTQLNPENGLFSTIVNYQYQAHHYLNGYYGLLSRKFIKVNTLQ